MNQSQKKTIFAITGLLAVSGGLFGYQNFFIPAQQQASKAIVYVAKNDVPADTKISEEMFSQVAISSDSILEGSVQNISEVVGKEVEGGLLKGEQLFNQRLSDETTEKGDLYVKIEPDFAVDVIEGENVRLFVQGSTETGENSVVELFSQKKVYSSSRETSVVEGETTEGYYIRMTDKELEDYYLAKSKGTIIMAKITTTEGDVVKNSESKETKEKLDNLSDKKTDKKTEKKTDKTNESNLTYEAKEGDTFESIAHDLEASVETLNELNPDIKTVQAGDLISIPAE